MRKLVIMIMAICILGVSQGAVAQDSFRLIRVHNPRGDLSGENWRDYIILWWQPQDEAKTYIVYRALSANEPWVELVRKNDEVARIFGMLQDITELTRTNNLCYKVEAVNDLGQLVRVYEAVCVPKFVYL